MNCTTEKPIAQEKKGGLEFKVQPHSEEAEIGVIEACFADPPMIDKAREYISDEDFYRRGRGRVFGRMVEFSDAGRAFTLSLIEDSFRADEDFWKFRDFLDELRPITGQTVSHYSKIVLEMAVRRELITATEQVLNDLHDLAVPVNDSLTLLKSAARQAGERGAVHAS